MGRIRACVPSGIVHIRFLPSGRDESLTGVFRHNRRSTPMAAFQTLLGLGAIHPPTTYAEITRRAA